MRSFMCNWPCTQSKLCLLCYDVNPRWALQLMSQQCGSDSNTLYTSAQLHSTTLADLPLHGLTAVVPKNFHFQSYHLQLIVKYLGAKNFHWQWYRIATLHLVSSLERPIFSQILERKTSRLGARLWRPGALGWRHLRSKIKKSTSIV